MTYDEAMRLCKKGQKVRHADMGERWSIFYIPKGKAKGFFALNPHTGSNYQFTPSNKDMLATTWEIMPW